MGCRGDGALEQVVDGDRAIFVEFMPRAVVPVEWVLLAGARVDALVVDGAFESLVDTVLAPGLGEGFQFDLVGFAAEGLVVGANGLHLGQIQKEVAVAAEPGEGSIVQISDRDGDHDGLSGVSGGKAIGPEGAGVEVVDDGVGQQSRGEALSVGLVHAAKLVSPTGLNGWLYADEVGDRLGNGLGCWVHDARLGVNFDSADTGCGFSGSDVRDLADGVGEHCAHNRGELVIAQGGFDQVDAGDLGVGGWQPGVLSLAEQVGCSRVAHMIGLADLDSEDAGGCRSRSSGGRGHGHRRMVRPGESLHGR